MPKTAARSGMNTQLTERAAAGLGGRQGWEDISSKWTSCGCARVRRNCLPACAVRAPKYGQTRRDRMPCMLNPFSDPSPHHTCAKGQRGAEAQRSHHQASHQGPYKRGRHQQAQGGQRILLGQLRQRHICGPPAARRTGRPCGRKADSGACVGKHSSNWRQCAAPKRHGEAGSPPRRATTVSATRRAAAGLPPPVRAPPPGLRQRACQRSGARRDDSFVGGAARAVVALQESGIAAACGSTAGETCCCCRWASPVFRLIQLCSRSAQNVELGRPCAS